MGKPCMKNDKIFQGSNLPVLPPGATYLLEALADDNIEIPQLAEIIERVPTVAARLIALANSAWSSPVKAITSLDQACARLGLGVVRSTSIALAVSSPFDMNRCPAFDAKTFWASSLLTAEAAALFTHLMPPNHDLQVSTSRTAGLLHNLGLLLLADQMPGEVQLAIEKAGKDSAPSLRLALQSICGLDYTDAGAYLSEAWGLPEPLSTAIEHHANPDYEGEHWQVACLVGASASMVSSIQRKTPWAMSEAIVHRLDVEVGATNRLFESLAKQAELIRKLAEALFVN